MFVIYKCMYLWSTFLSKMESWQDYDNEDIKNDAYLRRESTFIFSCLSLFGLMKFCENVSILNTKPITLSATTPIPFSKKYKQERHKRIERHSVPESVK